MNKNKQNLAVALRRCADCLCDESCPYFSVDPDCEVKLLRDAADALEEVGEDG